ncbi:MAG TPA: radical SAM protein [Methanothermococcus okinawensis]|uniref:Radical SAM protein n=1 Tax=Methanothermococcus okinawensis TaxID=155863 RepID=A0A833E5Z3_9EURY|nr:radical SAM protein [Methanothermococcus okinawensis]
MKEVIDRTLSICPKCFKRIPAIFYEEENVVYIEKTCPEHGMFKDIYWSDAQLYKKFNSYEYISSVKVTHRETEKGCPYDCGLCPNHKTPTVLANIDLTNRCNLNCPICFANAGKTGVVYEPSFQEVKRMMEILRSEIPPTPAIQFAGGEPTLREDLFHIIELAKEMGFVHTQLATNGLKLKNREYVRKLKEVGLSTIYLQFDGISERPYLIARGRNLLPFKMKVIENCRDVGFNSVVLVPTLVKGVNDGEVGDIIRYGVKNFDVIRGVNFQPVSFTGRIEEEKRLEGRITIPDFIRLVEEQTHGEISREDFYPVPVVAPISLFVENILDRKKPVLGSHQHCGVSTYVFVEDGKMIPFPRFFDVEGFLELIKEKNEELIEGKKSKIRSVLDLSLSILKLIDRDRAPKSINVKTLANFIVDILRGSYTSLVKLHHSVLMIGCMHFMDPYNFDIRRCERCCIHYALPDGRVIPFCTFNTIHRPLMFKGQSCSGEKDNN